MRAKDGAHASFSLPISVKYIGYCNRQPIARRSTLDFMRVAGGKVVGGKIVVDDTPLTEGASVTVLVRENDETFQVTPEDEAALLRAIADADRNDLVSAEQVLKDLRNR